MLLLSIDYPPFLTVSDLIVAPIFLLLLFMIVKDQVKKIPDFKNKKYYLPAFCVRILGTVLTALMYQYYYGKSDVYGYYHGSIAMQNLLFADPKLFLDILFYTSIDHNHEAFLYFFDSQTTRFVLDNSTFLMLKIGGVLSVLTFNSFLAIGFIFSYFSFKGCWKLFEVFFEEYPALDKWVAVATLFIPSVFFWGGAGFLKDTLMIGVLGYLVWSYYQLFIKGRMKIYNIIVFVLSIFFMLILKAYVVISLLPCFIIWSLMHKVVRTGNRAILKFAVPGAFVLVGLGGLGLLEFTASKLDDRFAPQQLIKIAKGQQQYVGERAPENNAPYELGDYDTSVFGVLTKVPSAINVTLFRPYPWEVNKIIMLPSMIEALIALLLTIFVFIKVGFIRTIQNVFLEPNILFCLIFTMIFAFGVGFIACNFGTLARYKIACLPFYFMALFILLNMPHLNNKASDKNTA